MKTSRKKSKQSEAKTEVYVLPPPPQVKRRKIALSNLADVRREVANTYRKMVNGEIDPSDGTKLAFVLATAAKVIESDMLEKRVKELEWRAYSNGA